VDVLEKLPLLVRTQKALPVGEVIARAQVMKGPFEAG
jgi:hypothetical protein